MTFTLLTITFLPRRLVIILFIHLFNNDANNLDSSLPH